MSPQDSVSSAPEVWPVLQSCGESCAAFRPVAPDSWSDYGWCTNPRSPRRGEPVRVGRECAYAVNRLSPREA